MLDFEKLSAKLGMDGEENPFAKMMDDFLEKINRGPEKRSEEEISGLVKIAGLKEEVAAALSIVSLLKKHIKEQDEKMWTLLQELETASIKEEKLQEKVSFCEDANSLKRVAVDSLVEENVKLEKANAELKRERDEAAKKFVQKMQAKGRIISETYVKLKRAKKTLALIEKIVGKLDSNQAAAGLISGVKIREAQEVIAEYKKAMEATEKKKVKKSSAEAEINSDRQQEVG